MEGIKILVVEDEGIVAMEIAHRLSLLGFDVCGTASTGKNAISMAEQHKPDLVLMDIKLKGNMNGIEAAIIIKEQFSIPSVFITANSDEGTVRQIKQSLNFLYLFKPFEEEELSFAIKTALNSN